ncbi:MAG: S9 family peptidase [bacterium]|nr:S9 family peptidase [bacterium]
MNKQTLKFGSWPSNISAEFVAGKNLRFQSIQAHDDQLFWSEVRPSEQGRAVLVCAPLNASTASPAFIDLLPPPFSARSKVHEYGGGSFIVTPSLIFFVNADDQQIWSIEHKSNATRFPVPQQITDAPHWRFADMCHDPQRNRLICVGEQKKREERHPENFLVSIPLAQDDTQQIVPLVQGDDFYAFPRLSPDAQQLAFVSWNLPSMPWEHAQLQIANLEPQGSVLNITCPNSAHTGASFQPEWDQHGDLWFINDDSGFGQLYRLHDGHITQFPQDGAEMGDPLWVFGMKTYGFLQDGSIAVLCRAKGEAWITLINPADESKPERLHDAQSNMCGLEQLVTAGNHVAGILSTIDKPNAIASIFVPSGETTILKPSINLTLTPEQISIAKVLAFENELGQIVFGNYYPPANKDYEAPAGELPPVILTAHGGPTAYAHAGLAPKVQYWTSRGFGYFDVNYGGSWGFGKAYRQRLDDQWGVRDVADMIAAASYLVEAGLADPARLIISGSSAGGYTVLMALAKSDLFAAGASYYGISDLARLCDSTHKFEAGYIVNLLGLDADNKSEILKERSPLFCAGQISAPVIFFQGLQDKVVPPDQAELMVAALEKNGIKTLYQSFETEGHGFRDKYAIETALTMEYKFYVNILAL